nr:PAS domain S-box protein [uncultured Hyphomonas sp.]
MNRSITERIDDVATVSASMPLVDCAVGIAHIDLDGVILKCNRCFSELLGYQPDELAGRPVQSVAAPDECEEYNRLHREIRDGARRTFQINRRALHKDGRSVWVSLTMGCIRGAQGEIEHFVAIISDITEKHQTSEALAESEARFRATFENAAVGMALVDPNGKWLRVNQKVCDVIGYSPEELLQLTFQDITHPDDLDIDLELLEDILRGRRDSFSMDKRYFRKDGCLVWAKLTVGCVRTSNGDVDYFISVIEDITNDKRKDEALHRGEERFRATFENAAIGMAQVAPDGRWLNVNRKTCEILGYSKEELRQTSFQSLTHPDDLRQSADMMNEVLAGKRSSVQLEKRYIHKAGHIVWVNLSVACVRNQKGEVDYMISVIDDITERRRMRQELDTSEARFQAIQSTIPEGFMIFRSVRNSSGDIEDFVCEYSNPASVRLLMMDPDDVAGHKMLESNPGNRDIGLFDAYCRLVETGETIQGELEFPLRNGTFGWFRYSAVRVDDGFAVSFTDINDAKSAELELRRSEERFRAAQQTAPDGFVMFRTVLDAQGGITDFVCEYANPAAAKILNKPIDMIVGHSLLNDADFHRGHPLFGAYSNLIQSGEPLDGEFRVTVSGNKVWLRIAAVRIETGFAAAFSDVTERKKSELRLRESEARLRAFHQTTPDGFIIFESIRGAEGEITDFQYTYANPAAERLAGLDQEQLRKMTMLQNAPLAKEIGIFAHYVDVVESGKPWRGEFFYPISQTDGAWFSATAAKVDDGLAVSFTDISKHKAAEATLKEQERRARAILNNLISFVTLLTPDGIVIEVNDSVLATADLAASDVVGKYYWDTYWWSHDADAREELRRSVLKAAGGERVHHDTTVRVSGDERIFMTNMLAPVIDENGRVTHVVASGFDISDRKKAEQHREMLLGELSHRVKNSLATVQTIASHTLREASDLESFRDTFVGRLMAISKCHDLLVDTTRRDADISQLVRDQVLPYAQGGLERQVTMSGPPLVLGPEAAHTFGLILHELATNAAKYGALSTEHGRLSISWGRGSDRDRLGAVLTWAETGGPPVEPPTRRGFGSVLIEQSLTHSLGGEAEIDYRPEGLWAQFRFRKRAQ